MGPLHDRYWCPGCQVATTLATMKPRSDFPDLPDLPDLPRDALAPGKKRAVVPQSVSRQVTLSKPLKQFTWKAYLVASQSRLPLPHASVPSTRHHHFCFFLTTQTQRSPHLVVDTISDTKTTVHSQHVGASRAGHHPRRPGVSHLSFQLRVCRLANNVCLVPSSTTPPTSTNASPFPSCNACR